MENINGMYSIKEIYRIGRGPSSSHTMAPSYACAVVQNNYPEADEYKIILYGSLAKTGKGHRTDYAITSFKSRTTLVPCSANTIGPGLFLQADYIIGGCDGALGRGMGWQGMSFLTTLHYGPDMNITSTFMPTMPGKLFYLKELAGPLTAECN